MLEESSTDGLEVRVSNVFDCSVNTELTGNDIQLLKSEVDRLKQELSLMKKEVTDNKFSLAKVSACNTLAFYTGFPCLASLQACFRYLGPSVNNLTYWSGNSQKCDVKSKGRPRALPPIEEFFLVLLRLRLGLFEQDIADRFGVSCSTVSRVFATWINFLYLKFKEIPLWPPREVIQSTMPKVHVFRDKYPMTRVIIDATEIFVEKPSLPDIQQMTFSSYKNDNTFKALVGISPSGAVIFVSDLYPGGISDRELTCRSGILSLLQKGDYVMADRGFDIQDVLTPLGVKLNMPPFLRGKQQLNSSEMIETRRIASLRIHVERAMERIKNYHIFDKTLPSSLTDIANQIFFVCAVLCNFWPPLC